MVLNCGADLTLVFLYLTSNLVSPTSATSSILLPSLSSSSSSSSPDMLYIRHGRSRVRHSNEKDHIRWGLKAFDNLTLDYDGADGGSYENDTMILFGSDFWALENGSYYNQSDVNGSSGNNFNLFSLNSISSSSSSSINNIASTSSNNFINLSNILNSKALIGSDEKSHATTPSSVTITTTIKKKLAKKKIMESIKKNVDKGLEYLKAHKNLEEESFSYQNDVPSLPNSAAKKQEAHSDSLPSAKVSPAPDLGQEKDANNLPHSVPARLTVTYKEQQAAREGTEAQNTETIDKTVGTIQLGFEPQDDNTSSMMGQLFLETSSTKTRARSNNRRSGKKPNPGSTKGYTNQENTDQETEVLVLAGDDIIDASDDVDSDSDEIGITSNVYGTTDEDLMELDEISRNNRLNLMKGRDVVTKFLQIVETQHLLGANCTAGTALNLGEGVVDQYAQDRFRVEAEVAVNRANMLTRIFKQTSPSVQASEHLLHASVLSMVEFDDDIFAAGNCFDWNQHPSKTGLFCPFAYRLPPPDQGASLAKDLAAEYHYLGNTSEWFFLARKNAEKVIARNEQYIKAYHLYSNSTSREADEILSVKYEDGRWSKPYYDCGGGNIWMLTYTVPFFGYENGTYFFKGTSGIDIDLRRVDIDQCPQRNTPGTTQPLNIFAGTDKCKQRTTMCEAITGLGFRRGSYKCVCRKGFYYPDTTAAQKYFNGSILEEEYEKLMLGEESTYSKPLTYECLPCAEGCDSCEDASPCVAALNWPMRTSILVLACAVIGLLPPAAWFTFRYQQVKVVRAASPALLRVIALGAFFIYCTTIVMYPPPSLYTCTARIWLREIGFSLTYGALMLKTWRISVIFRVRSAKAVKITDAALLKRLGVICGAIGACLLVRTVVSPPEVVVGRTADDLKAFLCKTDWWDYTFTSMEVLFLAWGVRLCIMVRKAPSEFNESRFISMAIYNEFLLTCFLNVSMLFLQSPANPDLLYIIFFCHTQLTVTLLLGLIFGSKVYIVLRSGKAQENAIGLGAKSSGAKFNFRPQIRTFANPSTATSSTVQLADAKLSEQEALEEIRQLSVQLQRIQELAPPRGIAVMTISSLLDGLKTTTHQLSLKPPSLPTNLTNQVLPLTNDIQKYHNSNAIAIIQKIDKSINTSLSGDTFWQQIEAELRKNNEKYQSNNCTKIVITDRGNSVDSSNCHDQSKQSSAPTPPDKNPGEHGDVSFSDLHLKCMCSDDGANGLRGDLGSNNSTDIRLRHDHHYSVDRISDCNKTNDNDYCTAISSNHRDNRKFHSSCNLIQTKHNSSNLCDNHKSNDHFLICDTCKNRIVNNRSIELNLDSRLLIDHSKSLSHDDISFHSTDDDDHGDHDRHRKDKRSQPNGDNEKTNSNNCNKTDSKKGSNRSRKQDKLVLDLNDRSKYTKEVSV